jgi:hypothetical protein
MKQKNAWVPTRAITSATVNARPTRTATLGSPTADPVNGSRAELSSSANVTVATGSA